MSWKTQLQILDMDSTDRLEARCKACGYVWYEIPCIYSHKSHMRQLFLDEFETVYAASNGTVKALSALLLLMKKRQRAFKADWLNYKRTSLKRTG